mgnify:FL=1
MNRFFSLNPNEIIPSKKEVIRYLGYRALHQPDETIDRMIDECILEMQKVLRPNLVYDEFDIRVEDGKCIINDAEIISSHLAKNLSGCNKVVMFAATIGSEADKLIRITNVKDSAKACVLQATGAMFIEEFVNAFNDMIDKEKQESGGMTKPRFSPGYGDLPLETQKLFFTFLNCSKIGLTLMNTLIMATEKSVTAFIGNA